MSTGCSPAATAVPAVRLRASRSRPDWLRAYPNNLSKPALRRLLAGYPDRL